MKDLIANAINMINNHDWYWMMCDYGYNENFKQAENHRNQFAKVINSINDLQIYSTLKNMWIANYNLAAAFRTNGNVSTYKSEIENLSKQLNIATFKN
jgi:hypothetical protein